MLTRRNFLPSSSATLVAALFVTALSAPLAHAWYGPICYPAKTAQITLTLPSLTGETPGDLKVDFDDNSGQLAASEVRASKSIANAHEIILTRTPESELGVVGVLLTSPRSHVSRKYELEFRKEAAECTGAIIRATEKVGAIEKSRSEKPRSEKPRRTRIQAKPVSQIQPQEPVTAPSPETYPAAEPSSEPSSEPMANEPAADESAPPAQPQQVQAPAVTSEPIASPENAPAEALSAVPAAVAPAAVAPMEDGSL